MAMELDGLNIAISADGDKASDSLNRLTATLEKLSQATQGRKLSGMNKLASKLEEIAKASGYLSQLNASAEKVQAFANSMQILSNMQAPRLTTLKNALSAIPAIAEVINNMPTINANKMQEIVSVLQPLESIQKNNLSNVLTNLKKIPDVAKQLETINMDKFATSIQRVTSAIKPLANEMDKIGRGFSALPTKIQRVIHNNEKLAYSNKKSEKSFGGLFSGINGVIVKFGILFTAAKRIVSKIGDWIVESNAYVENLNLFTVQMGEYTDEALGFAEKVNEAMGIDVSQWIRNQGVFKAIAGGFGVVEERANVMSKNLVQLGYDISSFFNIAVDESMTKLQSGLAGELEPLRRLGYALDQATLQQVAYGQGVKTNIQNMTQAQKSQLRYLAIMQQSTKVMGNMAREVHTPANAMRILGQQLTQLSRALGNMILPILMKVLPYVTATVRVLTELAQKLANFLGFELPTMDYSSVGNLGSGFEDVTDEIDAATSAAKKFKGTLSGIDQLNIIGSTTESGGSGSGGFNQEDFNFALPEYDFLAGLGKSADDVYNKVKKILTAFENNAAVQIVAEAVKWLWEGVVGLGSWIIKNPNTFTAWLMGIGTAIITYKVVKGLSDLANTLKVGGTLAVGLTKISPLFSGLAGILTNPWALAIGLVAGAIIGIGVAIYQANKDAQKADLEGRFGDIALSMEEVRAVAKKLTTSDLTIKLNVFTNEKEKLDTLKTNVETAVLELQKQSLLLPFGVSTKKDFKASIDDLISETQTYLEQKNVVQKISIDVLAGDAEIDNNLRQFADEYFNTNSARLKELGEKLKKVVSEGFINGKWIPDKFDEAQKLQKEILEITEEATNLEFSAKMKALELDFAGTSITVDNFKSVVQEAETLVEAQMKQLEEVRIDKLGLAIAKFNADGNETAYNEAVKDIESSFAQQGLNIRFDSFQFGVNTISKAYEKELSTIKKQVKYTTEEFFSQYTVAGWDSAKPYAEESLQNFLNSYSEAYQEKWKEADIDKHARKNIADLLKEMEPSATSMTKLAEESLKAGKAVPDNITKGLRDYHMLNALEGAQESIAFLVSENLIHDPAFLEAMSTSNDVGEELVSQMALGISSNARLVTDAAGTQVYGLYDTYGELINDELSPNVVAMLKKMGIQISKQDFEVKYKTELKNPTNSNMNSTRRHINSYYVTNKGTISTEVLNPSKYNISQVKDYAKRMFSGFTISAEIQIEKTTIPGMPSSVYKALGVKGYADGGFPASGEFFMAREDGIPELVGRMGGRTAVANNAQITEGIYQAVVSAMRDSGGAGGGNITLNNTVEVDGKEVARETRKYDRRDMQRNNGIN